mgnify:CR=1 FL=1
MESSLVLIFHPQRREMAPPVCPQVKVTDSPRKSSQSASSHNREDPSFFLLHLTEAVVSVE